MFTTVLLTDPSVAQKLDSASLDEDGVTFQFSSSNVGRQLDFYGINVGRLGRYPVGADGRIRLNLSRVAPRPGVCFFAVSSSSQEIVSLSRLRGFQNPFWERRGSAPAGTSRQPRAPEVVQADLDRFEADLASAKATLAREEGRRYRNGTCHSLVTTQTARSPFAYEGPAAMYYGAARCSAVIARQPLTCSAIRTSIDLGGDSSFSAPDCDGKLRAATGVLAIQTDRASAQSHAAIASAAAAAAARDPQHRPAVAGQCVRDVAARSLQLLADWRNQRDRGEGAEGKVLHECTDALAIVADEQTTRGELQAELTAARQRASGPTPARETGPSRNARDYPCSPS